MKNSGFICLIIAAVGDLLVPVLLIPFAENYDYKTMVLSVLGSRSCPVHLIYNAWLVTAGILFAVGSFTIYGEFRHVSKGLSMGIMICILVFAVTSCIMCAFFSVGETKDLTTLSAKIHGVGAVIGFLLLVVSTFLLGIISFRTDKVTFGAICVVSFLLAFTCYIFLAIADKPQFTDTFIAWEGMWEHLCLLFSYLPMIILSVQKLYENSKL